MQQTQFDYQKNRAAISLQYGIELDDTSLIILSILSGNQKKNFAEQNKILESAAEKISVSTKSLQVHQQKPGRQAFWFGMGKFGLALIFATSVLTAIYFYDVAKKQEQDKLPAALHWYKTYFELTQTGVRKNVMDFLKNNPRPGEQQN